MDGWTIFWIGSTISLTLCALFAGTVWFLSRLLRQSTAQRDSETEALSTLLDKALTMLGTKDPLAYQQVQAMSAPSAYDGVDYDPSDEGEVERIRSRSGALQEEVDLNAEEQHLLADLGVDPFFLRAD